MSKLWHRLWHHRPLSPFRMAYPTLAEILFGQTIPRCTFRELGKDCPALKEAKMNEATQIGKDIL